MPEPMQSKLDKGTLLVASPDISEKLFFRSVVLICDYTRAGSFGLILNKPLEIEGSSEMVSVAELKHPKVSLRLGGPMQQNQMMMLHGSEKKTESTLKVLEGVHLGGDLEFLHECLEDDDCPNVNICFGYTGWVAGELEKELMSGMWFLHPASAELVFQIEPGKIWQTVLKQMGGKYESLAMIPEDPSVN